MKLASLEDRRRIEVSTIEKEYERLKEVYKTQKSELSIELSRLRDQIDEVNRRKLDIETKYDRDVLLLRNEVQN